jgi:hypothetical protein
MRCCDYNNNNNSVQVSSDLFSCKFNSRKDSYKVNTSKEGEIKHQNTYKQNAKQRNLIIIIRRNKKCLRIGTCLGMIYRLAQRTVNWLVKCALKYVTSICIPH